MLAVPEIIKGATPQQRVLALELIKDFIIGYNLADPLHKSLLFVGFKDGDFLMEDVLPLIPSNITRIVATELTEEMVEKATKKYAAHKDRVTFQQLDFIDRPFKIREEFSCVMSIWCMRWMYNVKDGFPKLMSLVGKSGIACVLIDYNHNFFEAVTVLYNTNQWQNILHKINCAIPNHFKFKSVQRLISGLFSFFNRELKKHETLRPVVASIPYETTSEMQERMELQFTVGSYIPDKKSLDAFYNSLFGLIKMWEAVRIIEEGTEKEEGDNTNCKVESTHRVVFMKFMFAN